MECALLSTDTGGALIVGAIAFLGVFAYLANRFGYPAVLDGQAIAVLPALLATGPAGLAAWALYGFLPLIWLPPGVGAYYARGITTGVLPRYPGAVSG